MTAPKNTNLKEVALPFSNGLMSAKMWKAHGMYVVGVPELGIHCYGSSEQESAFRLFTSLLKYYRQLNSNQEKITEKGKSDLEFLKVWVKEIEKKMTAPDRPSLVSINSRFER